MLIDGGAVAGPPDSCQYVFIYIALLLLLAKLCEAAVAYSGVSADIVGFKNTYK